MKFTATQRRMLESAAEWTGKVDKDLHPHPLLGTGANSIGELSSLRSLARRGLVRFVGFAKNVMSDSDAETACYAITDAGREALRRTEVR